MWYLQDLYTFVTIFSVKQFHPFNLGGVNVRIKAGAVAFEVRFHYPLLGRHDDKLNIIPVNCGKVLHFVIMLGRPKPKFLNIKLDCAPDIVAYKDRA
ncbi:hypothetical protein SDC9_212936 [bioreactor metagenome]|uniref:Uncharacterized protein n=1 Tax=bioreactor metagenome TaxID=1076179 RepID=A0A645JPB1_9ZZZZ